MTMEDIDKMAAAFWLETGKNPTHLFLTQKQHQEFSDLFVPFEKIISNQAPNLVGSVALKNQITIDIVSCRIWSNNNEAPKFPMLMSF